MNMLEIIAKKRDGLPLSKEEIDYFITEYTKGTIEDYQAAALIMAIYINGMTKEEITYLTLAMAYSGDVLDLSKLGTNIVDKHSTGGVGDKITLILLPVIASLGVPVAKMSGRGLGYTGGTIDKLESIPGYQTNLSIEEFVQSVKKIGISLIGQTMNLAPADKKLYALRDTISCVESIPLIAASVMSKKIAAGANKIVIEATYGKGALMKTETEARELSHIMSEIGKLADKQTVCILTNMNQPLGFAIGNTLEVIEAIKSLKGNMPEDVKQVVLELGAYMIKLAGKGENIQENKEKILENLQNGKAYQKLIELVKIQGGDVSYIEDITKFEKAKYILPVLANQKGYIEEIDASEIGKLSNYLGAGRLKKEDKIDHAVGIVLNKKIGDEVEAEELLGYIHANELEKGLLAKEKLLGIYKIKTNPVQKEKHVIDMIE